MRKKLFDYVIGNPPYNEDFENSGDNGNFAKPVYNYFMDATYGIADKVELIHSVDSLRLARDIDRIGGELGLCPRILIEVNVAGEESKYGISVEELPDMLEQLTRAWASFSPIFPWA